MSRISSTSPSETDSVWAIITTPGVAPAPVDEQPKILTVGAVNYTKPLRAGDRLSILVVGTPGADTVNAYVANAVRDNPERAEFVGFDPQGNIFVSDGYFDDRVVERMADAATKVYADEDFETRTTSSLGKIVVPVFLAVALIMLAIGVVAYGFSIVLYIASAQQLGATRSQLIFSSAPFWGVLLSVVLLGEKLAAKGFDNLLRYCKTVKDPETGKEPQNDKEFALT